MNKHVKRNHLRSSLLASATALFLIASAIGVGCASTPNASPYTDSAAVSRDADRARRLHAEATEIQAEDAAGAERLLRKALAADLYHGPAHNNLGTLLLERGELYEAANEFEWARKLMPGHPAPRANLAMTLERAGKTERALREYDAALSTYDGYMPALRGKVRLQIASGRTDEHTVDLLERIALRGSPEWREWALLWKAKLQKNP